MSIKTKVIDALDRVGKTNGHACPASQDPLVTTIHEYNVSTLGESFFKKRREIAKTELLKKLGDVATSKVNTLVLRTKKDGMGDKANIIDTEFYDVVVSTKQGATYLDEKALRVELMTKQKMRATEVDELFERCRARREPAVSYEVVEK